MELSAEELERARRGERAAREALGAWCLRRAFRLAYVDLSAVSNRTVIAEEIAGEASLKAVTHLQQFQPGTRFDHWFHQIVRNCLRDHYRRIDQTVPPALYRRWIHDFLVTRATELEALVLGELGQEPSVAHPVLLERIASDLRIYSYRQFVRLAYEGRANAVLDAVKRHLRLFMGLQWLPLYEPDDSGDWVDRDLASAEDTEATVLQHEFVHHVNEHLAGLEPLCRRLIRWRFLIRLRVPEIARMEQMSERTAYRRIEACSASFRDRLLGDSYFAEIAGRDAALLARNTKE
jgi:RNA polymerase sigma factor (sigma-70 family)